MFVAKTQFLCEHNYVPVEKDDTKCLNYIIKIHNKEMWLTKISWNLIYLNKRLRWSKYPPDNLDKKVN